MSTIPLGNFAIEPMHQPSYPTRCKVCISSFIWLIITLILLAIIISVLCIAFVVSDLTKNYIPLPMSFISSIVFSIINITIIVKLLSRDANCFRYNKTFYIATMLLFVLCIAVTFAFLLVVNFDNILLFVTRIIFWFQLSVIIVSVLSLYIINLLLKFEQCAFIDNESYQV